MYVAVIVATAVVNLVAAAMDFLRAGFVVDNMAKYGVPRSWINPLGVAKAAGALGLLAGLAVPAIGVAAAVGLVLFFVGAVVTVTRSRWYSHLVFPTPFLLLAGASLALSLQNA